MPRLYVATRGDGLYRSDDLGATWTRDPGLPAGARLYALCSASGELLAGAEGRVYRYSVREWSELALPVPAASAWSVLAADGAILAGTRPIGVLRSADGGRTWERLPLDLPGGTPSPHTPRITSLLLHASVPRELWAGVEVGGVFTSGDAGRTWSPVNEGIPSLDIHALAWSSGGVLLAATPVGVAVWRSGRWLIGAFDSEDRYCRSLAVKPDDPATLYCGFGDGPPGSRGGVAISRDGGRSWRARPLPSDAGSTVWSVATAADAPDLVVACSISGGVFVSRDRGMSWATVLRTGAEARAVACLAG